MPEAAELRDGGTETNASLGRIGGGAGEAIEREADEMGLQAPALIGEDRSGASGTALEVAIGREVGSGLLRNVNDSAAAGSG